MKTQQFFRVRLCAPIILGMMSVSLLTVAEPRSPSWQIEEDVVVVGERDRYSETDATVIRGDINIQDWPQSVQVLNRTLLDEQNLQTLTEALSNVSGVVPSQDQEQVLVNPFVRGLESEVYLDGLIAYGDTAVIDPSSLAVIERVEVAKGATSVLFGGGVGAPTGGLINLVTKTPGTDPRYRFQLRSGSLSTSALQTDLNQPINDSIQVRLAAEWFESDDTVDAVEVERTTINPSARWLFSDKTELIVRGFYNKIDQLEYTGLPAEISDVPGVPREQFSGALNAPFTEIENRAVHATLNHKVSDSLSVSVQARHFTNEFDEFSSFPFLSFFPITGTSVPIIRGQLPVDTEETTVDVSTNYKFSRGAITHNLLAGITWDATDYEAGSGFDFTPIGTLDYLGPVNTLDFGAIPAINSETENEYRTVAIYFQDHFSIGDNWRVLLSGRYTRYGLEEIVGGTGADETYSEFDPRVGITYLINDNISLFGGYATGSRIVPFFTGVSSAAPVPEESESLEAGIKFSTNSLSGTLAFFELSRENIPQTDLTDPFFGSVQNGEQQSEGIELDLIWEPTPYFSLLGSAAYVDAINETDIASFGTIFAEGNQLSRIPEHSARIAGRYRFTEGLLDGFALGLGATYASEAPLTDGNVFYSDSYTVYDLQADYEIGNLSVRFNVVNLSDKEYFRSWQYLLQEVQRPGQERSAYITLGLTL